MTNLLPSSSADSVSFEPSRSRQDVANMNADAQIAQGGAAAAVADDLSKRLSTLSGPIWACRFGTMFRARRRRCRPWAVAAPPCPCRRRKRTARWKTSAPVGPFPRGFGFQSLRHGFWVPELRVVGLRICRAERGFGRWVELLVGFGAPSPTLRLCGVISFLFLPFGRGRFSSLVRCASWRSLVRPSDSLGVIPSVPGIRRVSCCMPY